MTHLATMHPIYPSSQQRASQQRGFTLLELMVAMTIFAVLAVAGWQVFDGLNRSKDRAQLQTTALSELQFAYLQIQKDMAQAIPYQLDSGGQGLNDSAQSDQNKLATASNGFTLSADSISFVRFADPDPRYQSSPLLERVVYRVENNNLIRQKFSSLDGSTTQTPLQSVLVSEVSQLHFQALTPDPVAVFPEANDESKIASLPSTSNEDAVEQKNTANIGSLPKGVLIEYEYQMGSQQVPISWQFALQSTPPIVNPTEQPKPKPKPEPEPEPEPPV